MLNQLYHTQNAFRQTQKKTVKINAIKFSKNYFSISEASNLPLHLFYKDNILIQNGINITYMNINGI